MQIMSSEYSRKSTYFMAGFGLGALATLLVAPHSGEETRRILRSKSEEGRDYLAAQGQSLRNQAEDLKETGRRAVEPLQEKARDIASGGGL